MTDLQSPLNDLIRKLDSDHYDLKVHGEGFIVTWNQKTREVVEKRGFIKDVFSIKHYEFFFVRTHTKPIVIKQLQFEWHEGTSDISLEFDATFKLRVTSEDEAKQLVRILSQSGSPEKGLLNLIDKNLYVCMARIYEERQLQSDKNLLSDFYQEGLQKGECARLNADVTREMQTELKGTDFGIGFTLRNAPERFADFKYDSEIKETGLKVASECQLTLNNYQAYRKSGIGNIEGVVAHMQEGIDRAIRQHILGKTEMELLSNFKTASSQALSISDQVKQSVSGQARAIGYELESFHTLPDIAPLQLLNGLMLVFDENDGAFKTGVIGGRIRLNMRLEIKAIEGEFDKYRHLFSNTDTDHQLDLLNITQTQILNRIKVHLEVICKEVLRQHQDNHLKTLTHFDTEVRPTLEAELVDRMRVQHGLDVTVKTLMPVESEDASRLEELRRRKRPFNFDVFSSDGSKQAAKLLLHSSFEVLSLDFDDLNSWEAFEGHDYGYRMDSAERNKQGRSNTDDRHWKTDAIEHELKDIEGELIRFFKSSDLLIPDMNLWLNDRKHNMAMQNALIDAAKEKIQKSRGLLIEVERLDIQDEQLNQARLAQRTDVLENIRIKDKQLAYQHLEDLKNTARHKTELNTELKDKEVQLIDEEISDFDQLSALKKELSDDEETANRNNSALTDFVPQTVKTERSDLNALEDILGKNNTQKKGIENNDD